MNRLLQLFDGKEFIFMDGATGTMLQQKGTELGKVPEILNMTEYPAIVY